MFTDAYWPRTNGVTVSIESFSRALIRAGHSVLIVAADYPYNMGFSLLSVPPKPLKDPADEPDLMRVPSRPVLISKEDRLAKSRMWFKVAKRLNSFKPDIIHVHTEFTIGIFGLNYASLYGIPLIYTAHTMWEEYAANYIPYLPSWILKAIARTVLKTTMRRADAIISPSSQMAGVIERYKIKRRVWQLPTGIDPRLFTHGKEELAAFRARLDERFPRMAGARILLFAGRVTAEKNISMLVAAFARIHRRVGDTILFLAGDGPHIDQYRDEAKEAGVLDACVFSGYIERHELALLYGVSTVFTFPSRTETQGLVTIEAMLSGVPVVAVGEMGTINVMGGDNGGFMVANDPEVFADRVVQLLEDPTLHARKVLEAREHAKSWTIDSMCGRLEAIYHETIVEYNASPRSRRRRPMAKWMKALSHST